MKKELVISIFDYEPYWIKFLNKDIKVSMYRKGESKLKDNEILIEPNVGRDVHTFFKHILVNYDNLSDITFFCQDFPFDHWENIIQTVNGDEIIHRQNAQMVIGGYYGYHYNTYRENGNRGVIPTYGIEKIKGGGMWNMYNSFHHGGKCISCMSSGFPQHEEDLNLDYWWHLLFKNSNPDHYEFIPGGHFAITSNHARTRSKNFYNRIINLLEKEKNFPWIMERFGPYIFNPNYIELDELK